MLRLLLTMLALGVSALQADQVEPRILILGDNVTYDGRWVVQVESAIRAQPGLARIPIVNLALPSETVSGLSEAGHAGGSFPRPDLHERLPRVLAAFKPTLVILCYGLNDGIYLPLDETRFRAFRDGMTSVRTLCLRAEAKVVILTPPPYMADRASEVGGYAQVVTKYSAWLVEQRQVNWQVIDLHTRLREAIAAGKKADAKFIFAKDGIHPGDEGHRLIARLSWDGLAPLLKWNPHTAFAEAAKIKVLTPSSLLLRNAWLTKTGHKRPGLPEGLPLEQAEVRSATILGEYLKKEAF